MATYSNLAGAGTQALSSNVSRLYIDVVTFGKVISTGRAAPTNYFHLGLVRLGVQGAYYPPVPIDAAQMVLDVPPGVTTLGYSLQDVTTITVIEVIGPLSNSDLMPWDRSPALVNQAGNAVVSTTSGEVQAWTYTVPSGRILYVAHARVGLVVLTAYTSVTQGYCVLRTSGTVLLAAYSYALAVNSQNYDFLAGDAWYFPAGTVLVCAYSNAGAGGSTLVTAELSGFLFNA